MNKHTKLDALKVAMTTRLSRDEQSTEHYFTDGDEKTHEEIKELKDLFLEHYNVADLDYQIFSEACDIVSEVYEGHPTKEQAQEELYDMASDCASVYTSVRLSYLSHLNEDEVSQIMREYGTQSIATACAIWYDKQVEQAAIILNDWVHAR